LKILYFDIDGTLLSDSEPKPALAQGVFEQEVRAAAFERLVCVGGIVTTIRFLLSRQQPVDGLRMVFEACKGIFCDWNWFASVATLVEDPEHRVRYIDRAADWYYLDDLAEAFFMKEGFPNVFRSEMNRRVLAPTPSGDGSDILLWLGRV